MKNKKLLIALIAVMLVQLIVPIGFVVNSKIVYNNVEKYGTEYKMKLDGICFNGYDEQYNTYSLWLSFIFDGSGSFYDEEYNPAEEDVYICKLDSGEAVFTKTKAQKEKDNYISKFQFETISCGFKKEQICAAGETYNRIINGCSYDDGYAVIKVYEGRVILKSVNAYDGKLVSLDVPLR